MFAGTELPTEGETFIIPIKATATGIIQMWFYRERETLGSEILEIPEGSDLCAIEEIVNGFPRLKFVTAPVAGYIDKIIKKEKESVREGETIAEWVPAVPIHIVPPEIPQELYPFIG